MHNSVLRSVDPLKGAPPLRERMPVLVVDDDPACVALSVALLRVLGYAADSATNGEEALQVFDPTRHALVVTDNEMEPIKGTELAVRLKERSPKTPIIMCSGRPPEGAPAIDGVITKPLSLEVLRTKLEQVLNHLASSAAVDTPRRSSLTSLPLQTPSAPSRKSKHADTVG